MPISDETKYVRQYMAIECSMSIVQSGTLTSVHSEGWASLRSDADDDDNAGDTPLSFIM
jgi:hypothetical protein